MRKKCEKLMKSMWFYTFLVVGLLFFYDNRKMFLIQQTFLKSPKMLCCSKLIFKFTKNDIFSIFTLIFNRFFIFKVGFEPLMTVTVQVRICVWRIGRKFWTICNRAQIRLVFPKDSNTVCSAILEREMKFDVLKKYIHDLSKIQSRKNRIHGRCKM